MPSERTRKAMSRIVGIDLGTTNSLVGYVDETTGLPRVIPDAEGCVLLPSVVSFTREGVLVGEAAKRLLVRRPATTIYSVKRLMGRGYEDIKERSEEHTSELQSLAYLVCRLLLEKKNKIITYADCSLKQ